MDGKRTLHIADLGVVEYEEGLALQNALVTERQADKRDDLLLLLEHPHVFTLGRGADERYLSAARWSGVPVHRVSRGGEVTYHGPGQLVGYPILKLTGRDRDVHAYLRNLEHVIIRALAAYGIDAQRRDGLTGVWVGGHKIASIGVGIKRWVTCHGFALNVQTELGYFDRIVPCGIEGCRMTSISELGQPDVSVTQFAQTMRASFCEVFGYEQLREVEPEQIRSLVDRNPIAGEADRMGGARGPLHEGARRE